MPAKELKIVPYLTVSDAHKALQFLKEGFGAKIVSRMNAEDGKRLIHAEAVINGHSIYLSDEFPEFGGRPGPEKMGGTPVTMHINLKRPADVDKWVERAASAGAKITMPVADMFWGDRYGRVEDPFGHDWGFGAALPKPKKKAGAKKAASKKVAAKKPAKKAAKKMVKAKPAKRR